MENKSDTIHPAPDQFSPGQLNADPILRFFHYAHLPAALQSSSAPFCGLAALIVETLPRNAERTVALRKLLEAKDAAVRSNVGSGVLASGSKAGEGSFFTRLKLEHRDLAEKLRMLDAHLNLGSPGTPPAQVDMLNMQAGYMREYLAILTARIENIEHETGQTVRIPALEGLEEGAEAREIGDADIDRTPINFEG